MDRFKEQIQSPIPVLVDFYAEWCGPCKMMKPRLLDVAERMSGKAKVIEIDVDKEKELAERYRIQSVPTFIIFKNGEQLWRQSGLISTIALYPHSAAYGVLGSVILKGIPFSITARFKNIRTAVEVSIPRFSNTTAA